MVIDRSSPPPAQYQTYRNYVIIYINIALELPWSVGNIYGGFLGPANNVAVKPAKKSRIAGMQEK